DFLELSPSENEVNCESEAQFYLDDESEGNDHQNENYDLGTFVKHMFSNDPITEEISYPANVDLEPFLDDDPLNVEVSTGKLTNTPTEFSVPSIQNPFTSDADLQIAEFILNHNLSEKTANELIHLIRDTEKNLVTLQN
ncbi:hypothetical protein HK096_010984, partial [Nowakowskiella sp. JEL0078]